MILCKLKIHIKLDKISNLGHCTRSNLLDHEIFQLFEVSKIEPLETYVIIRNKLGTFSKNFFCVNCLQKIEKVSPVQI